VAGLKKEDLFINACIDISYACAGMSYWDAYALPVPIRKYFIRRIEKYMTSKQQQEEDDPQPLSAAEKLKFKK
jgi:hypothetical protein